MVYDDTFMDRVDQRKGFQKAEKKLAAKMVLRRVAWLDLVPVYWTGVAPDDPFVSDCAFRPITTVLADRLAGLSPGLYALELDYGPLDNQGLVNPRVKEVVPVNPELVAVTSRALKAADLYPRILKEMVGDVRIWRANMEERLSRITGALRIIAAGKPLSAEWLTVEEEALWVGTDASRPGRYLATEVLREAVAGKTGQARSAAVALGQRRAGAGVDSEWRPWIHLGAHFSAWPTGLVHRVAGPAGVSEEALPVVRADPVLNSEPAALAALEHHLVAPDRTPGLLKRLPGLLAALEAVRTEPARRWGMFLDLIGRAFHLFFEEREYSLNPGGRPMLQFRSTLIALLDEAVRLNEKIRYLPPPDRQAHEMIQDAVRWFLGFCPPRTVGPASMYRAGDRDALQKAVYAWIDQFQPRPEDENLSRAGSFCGLIGRLTALIGAVDTVTRSASWLDQCRLRCAPERDGRGALRLAEQILEKGVSYSGETTGHLERLTGILDQCGRDILTLAIRRLKKNHETILGADILQGLTEESNTGRAMISVLAGLGGLTLDDCRWIVAHDLFKSTGLAHMIGHCPTRLPEYVKRIRQNAPGIYHEGGGHALAAYLTRAEDGKLIEHIERWAGDLVRAGRADPRDLVCLLDLVDDFCHDEDVSETDAIRRRQFLLDNLQICDMILEDVARYRDGLPPESRTDDWVFFESPFQRRSPLLEIADLWQRDGYPDSLSAVTTLLEVIRAGEKKTAGRDEVEFTFFDPEWCELGVALSGGDRAALSVIFAHNIVSAGYAGNPREGWTVLAPYPEAPALLRACARHVELIGRAVDVLRRAAYCVRVRGEGIGPLISTWANPLSGPGTAGSASEDWPAGFRSRLETIAAYRGLAGLKPDLPREIRKIIDRPRILFKEYQVLERRSREGTLRPEAETRLDQVRRYLDDPEELRAWVDRDLERVVEKQGILCRLVALEHILEQAVREQWQKILQGTVVDLDDPDRNNAFYLLGSVDRNRRLLRELLRSEISGDGDRFGRHPANLAFLEDMTRLGLDMAAWNKPHEKTMPVSGERWTVYLETDPLKVLQMGNLFGTCLSVGNSMIFPP